MSRISGINDNPYPPGKAYMTEGELSDTMFNVDVGGRRYSISFDSIKPESRDWFEERLTAMINEAFDQGFEKGVKTVHENMAAVLNIGSTR